MLFELGRATISLITHTSTGKPLESSMRSKGSRGTPQQRVATATCCCLPTCRSFHGSRTQQREPGSALGPVLVIPMLGLTQLSNYLTLKGSFSAVSKPNFASKYALESSRRDLQNALLCTVLVESVWVKKYTKINRSLS